MLGLDRKTVSPPGAKPGRPRGPLPWRRALTVAGGAILVPFWAFMIYHLVFAR